MTLDNNKCDDFYDNHCILMEAAALNTAPPLTERQLSTENLNFPGS